MDDDSGGFEKDNRAISGLFPLTLWRLALMPTDQARETEELLMIGEGDGDWFDALQLRGLSKC